MLGNPAGPAIFSQNFDGVPAPALPTGWTVSWSGAGAAWNTTSAKSDTSPNSAFAPDPPAISDNSLVSPPFTVPGSSAQLAFRHSYYTEMYYDGGALEISIGGAPFTDILAAGGSFLTNGYTQIISPCCGNHLANRAAWTGDSGGFITTIVNLPASAAGQTNQLRWRFCSDNGVGATGWYVDTITLAEGVTCCTANHPLIQSIRPSNTNVLIVWSSTSNSVYRLQTSTNLTAVNWADVPGDVVATGWTAFKIDVIRSEAQKFYRVKLVP
jgi:hypothetical protein